MTDDPETAIRGGVFYCMPYNFSVFAIGESGRPDPHISIHLKFVYIFINILQLLLIGVTDLFVDISTEHFHKKFHAHV